MAKLRFDDVAAAYKRIMADLQRKAYKPVYLLMGEEAYYIDVVADYIQSSVLAEAEKAFNLMVVYGSSKDVTARVVVELARRYPMMGARQVVVLREAQDMKDIDELELYLRRPLPSTLLAICCKGKTLDKRKALYKHIAKVGEVLETVPLYDNELAAWIGRYAAEQRRSIDPAAVKMLADHIGADLSRIVGELRKLAIVLPEGAPITAEHIERNIGISKDYNPFELTKAIAAGDVLKANRIALHFDRNAKDNPKEKIFGLLFAYFAKLYQLHMAKAAARGGPIPAAAAQELGIPPFFLKDYEAACRRYSAPKVEEAIALLRTFDMRGKGWGGEASTSYGDMLRELLYRIMH
ncbi:MAG: DNA polymerase III subunit delta [Prevotellaceae bacterium]|jgi:DNA polymerase-3 subunit delta|nr:DNA polymerase III subunit delta [Prevotellaceae bacterium]